MYVLDASAARAMEVRVIGTHRFVGRRVAVRQHDLPYEVEIAKPRERAIDGRVSDARTASLRFCEDVARAAVMPEAAFPNDLQHELVVLSEHGKPRMAAPKAAARLHLT